MTQKLNRWVFRRKWVVAVTLFLLSILFITRSVFNVNKNARLTSPITIRERERIQAAALQPVLSLPPPVFHPWCPKAIEMKLRYTEFSSFVASASGPNIYLGVRVEKPDVYIPPLIHELTALILYIGGHRFFVHVVFAEGAAPVWVESLGRTLNELRVAYKVTLEQPNPTSRSYTTQRANQKNLVLEPFYSGNAMHQLGTQHFDQIVLIEDSIFCAGDILELLYEHKFQGAELTCALEWRGGLIHDNWSIRTLTGKPPYMQSELSTFFKQTNDTESVTIPRPFLTDQNTRKRYRFLRSFPVFSCWSSVVIIDPRVFLPVSDLNVKGLRFRTAHENDPDKYSDTFVLCVGMWARSMYKAIMVPHASIGDTFVMYDHVRQDGRRKLPHPAGLEPEGKGLISYFRWTTKLPEQMVYHDYSLWNENERIGNWNESLEA